MAKVSVIIPTHNRAAFLRTAIISVLKQTFQEFELLIVDDASTDNPLEVATSFHDKRIRFIRHETNRGGSAARNTGIAHSTCDYIAFLDDDDEWFPEKLANQMALIVTSPPAVGCVYTGYVIVDRASGSVNGQMFPTKRGDLSKVLLMENPLGGTSSVLLKRECFQRAGLFDESLPSFQDYDLWIRISRHFHFDYIQEPMLRYYTHEKHIWTNLDALSRGIKIMVKKHGNSDDLRRYLSYKYLDLGVSYSYTSDRAGARESYLNAIKLYPFEIRHYFNLGLSLFGLNIFTTIKKAKAKIIDKAPIAGRPTGLRL